MSTDYDIFCIDCGVDSGIPDANHMEKEMLHLLSFREHLEKLKGLFDEEGGFWYDGRLCGRIQFLISHVGHDVRVRDEYGRFAGECREGLKCKHPEYEWIWKNCNLKEGHDGAHQRLEMVDGQLSNVALAPGS